MEESEKNSDRLKEKGERVITENRNKQTRKDHQRARLHRIFSERGLPESTARAKVTENQLKMTLH